MMQPQRQFRHSYTAYIFDLVDLLSSDICSHTSFVSNLLSDLKTKICTQTKQQTELAYGLFSG
jgi:hypothetical protein